LSFSLNPKDSNSAGFELHKTSIKDIKLLLKVIKAIIMKRDTKRMAGGKRERTRENQLNESKRKRGGKRKKERKRLCRHIHHSCPCPSHYVHHRDHTMTVIIYRAAGNLFF